MTQGMVRRLLASPDELDKTSRSTTDGWILSITTSVGVDRRRCCCHEVVILAWALFGPQLSSIAMHLSLKRRRELRRQHLEFYALFLQLLVRIRSGYSFDTQRIVEYMCTETFESNTPVKTTADKYRAPKGGRKIVARGPVWSCVETG